MTKTRKRLKEAVGAIDYGATIDKDGAMQRRLEQVLGAAKARCERSPHSRSLKRLTEFLSPDLFKLKKLDKPTAAYYNSQDRKVYVDRTYFNMLGYQEQIDEVLHEAAHGVVYFRGKFQGRKLPEDASAIRVHDCKFDVRGEKNEYWLVEHNKGWTYLCKRLGVIPSELYFMCAKCGYERSADFDDLAAVKKEGERYLDANCLKCNEKIDLKNVFMISPKGYSAYEKKVINEIITLKKMTGGNLFISVSEKDGFFINGKKTFYVNIAMPDSENIMVTYKEKFTEK